MYISNVVYTVMKSRISLVYIYSRLMINAGNDYSIYDMQPNVWDIYLIQSNIDHRYHLLNSEREHVNVFCP